MADVALNLSGDTAASSNDSPIHTAAEPPAALREEQICNAVAFLANPKVSAASAEAKTTFLVKKGLTSAEIDEAYRRAPSAPATVSFPPPAVQPAASQAQPYAPASPPGQQQVYGHQPQYLPQQSGQQVVHPYQVTLQPQQKSQQQQRPSWSGVVLAFTAMAAGGYGLQRLIAPYAREYYERWRKRMADANPAAAKLQAAAPADGSGNNGGMTPADRSSAGALAEAIKAQTEELHSTTKELKKLLETFQKESGRSRHAAPMEVEDSEGSTEVQSLAALRMELRADVRADLRAELRSFAQTIAELTGGEGGDIPASSHYDTPGRATPARVDSPGAAVVAASGAASLSSAASVHMNSLGGSSSNVIAQGVPVAKHGGDADVFISSHNHTPGMKSGGSSVLGEPPGGTTASSTPAMADVMAMMQAGVTPPNVRSDIVDAPPNSFAPPSSSRLTPPPKPWERSSGAATSTNGRSSLGSLSTHLPRPLSTASSVSDTAGGVYSSEAAEAHWKPPAVPQPSMTLPRHRIAISARPSQKAVSEGNDSDEADMKEKQQQPAVGQEQAPQGDKKMQSGSLHANAPEFKPKPSGITEDITVESGHAGDVDESNKIVMET